MAPPSMKSLLLVLAMVVMVGGGKAWIIKAPKVTVKIQNGLSQNQDLTLHCKSKDDDLGEHTLQNKASYKFSLRPRFFIHSTLFFCSFWWPSNTSLHYFDIYVEDRDWWCNLCAWTISESGACIYDELTRQTDCYPWNSA
ncbi:S-protein homolog 2-like [Neltuma alba]|uniref:S-protein homolog 2-like n=1 Tax=Neltuma alba TaxID=207710 RepID=UPI0010A45E47|nr:S-protein homolog 2-like [Prosopis alba]